MANLYILKDDIVIKKDLGYNKYTTNNQMELTAAIKALEDIITMNPNNININIHVDSMYLLNGITKWLNKWKKNNWKNAKKESVKNTDLWIKLDEYHSIIQQNNKTQWEWVKAHATNKYNNMVDQLANEAIDNNFK